MTSLTVFDADGLELVINESTGEAFATQSSYARMSGKAKSTINERLATVRLDETVEAEILTTQGLRTVRLIPSKLVFRWLMKDNPELAEKMGQVGAVTYLHQLAGFKISSNAIKSEPNLKLPPADIRVTNLISALDRLGFDLANPRFTQSLQDLAGDILGLTRNTLPATTEIWMGVAERAEQLGYPVGLVTKNRSQLGKFVKANGLNPIKEKRLCNGTQRDINLYLVDDALDAAIKEFMDAKTLAA